MTLEHSIRVYKGYDYRDDPNDTRGALGCRLFLITKGPLGAVTCNISTGWVARPLQGSYRRGIGPQRRRESPGVDTTLQNDYPTGGGVASHLFAPTEDWHQEGGPCDVLGVEKCYGDTGFLLADEVLGLLVEGGDDAAFARLDEIYADWIDGKESTP